MFLTSTRLLCNLNDIKLHDEFVRQEVNMLNLRKLRGDRTTRQIAIETGLTEATIRNAEEKPHLMSSKTLFALSQVYGVSIDEIIDKKTLKRELGRTPASKA